MAKIEAAAVLDAEPETPQPFRKGKPPKNKPPRAPREPGSNIPTFWQKCAAVSKPDWGARANIYVYRLEPLIDRTRGGGTLTYIDKYAEMISEDRLLADWGSGKYKLILNFRKPAADHGDEVDSIYLELLNMKFPPKVPPGEWMDDPRNKKWAWAKQEVKQGADQLESLRVFNELRQGVLEEVGHKADPTETFIEGMKFVQEQQSNKRTFGEELKLFTEVAKEMRPQETVPAFMQVQFQALQNQITASQDRADKLMMLLIETKNKPAENGSGISVVKELVGGLKELVPTVKDLFPNLGETIAGGGGHSRLSGWQEFTMGLAPHLAPFLQPFGSVLSQALFSKMTGAPGNPAPPGYPPSAPAGLPAAPGAPAMLMPFLQMIAHPMLNRARLIAANEDPAELGKEFSGWVYDGFSANPNYEQAMVALRGMGSLGIMNGLRSTPFWQDKGPTGTFASLAELEPKLPPFFDAFLQWTPESDDEPEETDPSRPVAFRPFSEEAES